MLHISLGPRTSELRLDIYTRDSRRLLLLFNPVAFSIFPRRPDELDTSVSSDRHADTRALLVCAPSVLIHGGSCIAALAVARALRMVSPLSAVL